MGYSHYWKRIPVIGRRLFVRVAKDFRSLLPSWKEHGFELAGWYGSDPPIITSTCIRFNGAICRHKPGDRWDLQADRRAARIRDDIARKGGAREDLMPYFGVRRCAGSCFLEDFVFPRCQEPYTEDELSDGMMWDSVKTGLKPYDLAVTSALLIARHHLGRQLQIFSDGGPYQWQEARDLCQRMLGYGSTTPLNDKAPAAVQSTEEQPVLLAPLETVEKNEELVLW